MAHRKRSAPPFPSAPPDPERAAAIARARRAVACEAEVKAVLARHRCAIQTVQQLVNGQPGPMQIQIVPLDTPAGA